jgi:hypothetical protein
MQAGRSIQALCDAVPSFSAGDAALAESEVVHR